MRKILRGIGIGEDSVHVSLRSISSPFGSIDYTLGLV
uniref:Uncharacterized protein n=1 Tax=Rhizophora mucronata TaxID=61149 RepID=A0A2P2L649_RHIMU